MKKWLLALVALILVPCAVSAPSTVKWEALPNSALTTKAPDPLPDGFVGVSGVTGGWNSAAFDSRRQQLLIMAAGGHADYAGNEVYSVGANGKIDRLTVPSPTTSAGQPSVHVQADGTPPSRHTYGGVGYDPDTDSGLICGGSRWRDGDPTPLCWRFHIDTKTWENLGTPTSDSNASEGRNGTPLFHATSGTPFMVWDPRAHKFIVMDGRHFAYLNLATMKSEPFACGAFLGYGSQSAVLDPAGRVLYMVGLGQTRRLDLSQPATNAYCPLGGAPKGSIDAQVKTTGATEIESSNVSFSDKAAQSGRLDSYAGIGLAFDPVAGVIVAYGKTADQKGGRVYTLDPKTGVWTAWEADPSGATPPVPTHNGVWNKLWFNGGCLNVLTDSAKPVYRACSLPWRTGSSLSLVRARAAIAASDPPMAPPGTFPKATWESSLRPTDATKTPLPNIVSNGATRGSPAKHTRMDYDPKTGRVLLMGGDRTGVGDGNGQGSVWATADGQTWTMLSAPCIQRPAGVLMPARPDNVIWAIDAKRNRGVLMPGFFFGVDKANAECPGPSYQYTSLTLDLGADTWQMPPWSAPPTGWGGDNGGSWGVIDPVGDALYRYFWDGAWGANVQRLDFATNTWSNIALGCSGGLSKNCSGGVDKDLRNSYAHRSQAAIDVKGRAIYWVTATNRMFRLRLDVAGHSGEWVGQAPAACVVSDANQEQYTVFDSDHRAVLHFCVPNLGGEVVGIAAYFVDTKQWAYYPAPMDQPHAVVANVFAYSPACHCVIATGGHLIYSENPARPGSIPNPAPTDANGDMLLPPNTPMLPTPIVNWTFKLQ